MGFEGADGGSVLYFKFFCKSKTVLKYQDC